MSARRNVRVVILAVTVVAIAAVALPLWTGRAGAPVAAASSYDFDNPVGIAYDGTHLRVTNANDSLTELDAANGDFVRSCSAPSRGLSDPDQIVFEQTLFAGGAPNVWITNAIGNSVTEMNTATDMSQVFHGAPCEHGPSASLDNPPASPSRGRTSG